MNLWDTAGQEDYDHIRALAYKDVDCFLVCFSVDSQSSFSNVKQKWIPSIIDSESSDASIVLVGTKQDLRNDKKVSSIEDSINVVKILSAAEESIKNFGASVEL